MYPKAYIDYLLHFHATRDYFECHEVLEEHWKRTNEQVWIGLIQLAVGMYHYRRGNIAGARRMLTKAVNACEKEKLTYESLGIHAEQLLALIHTYIRRMDNRETYESACLPIVDRSLLHMCQRQCEQKGLIWGEKSDMSNEYIIHKHMLRDRSDVIAERERQKQKRQGR
ncbi:DUF309 domain-containing protein [Anoxybacillus flavithermus]|uniref:Metal-dependent hydrolase n=1 Tax=Anoxybacillus flavithermus AK1 TaxID=1297581 RepID=M8D939_9BACL|nr:DUF309 domain-containing protein [Anoxybacillus flavithermus]EMT47311.1 metal-dependent hydrolase [Anoxybacillus flavithermus AK1]